jgi:hypothetical protein
MQYCVKTTFGLSEKSYQGTDELPLFDTGQAGSGALHAVWLTLVVILMHTRND